MTEKQTETRVGRHVAVWVKSLIAATMCLLAVAVQAAGETRIIAFAQDNMANDFRRAQVFEVRDAVANYPDTKFVYSDAKGETALIIRQIGQFVDQAVDLIVVGTNDESAVVPVLTRAFNAGVPVIVLDRGVKTDLYTTFIHSDNVLIGQLGAEYIARRLDGKGKVLLLEGLQTADVTHLRNKGFLDEMARHPEIAVVRRTGNYLRRDALIEMEKLLAEGIEVDAIFSESDSMLSGVRSVLDRHGIDPSSIITIGCDYTTEARAAIRSGRQTGSVLFPLGGKQAVEAAVAIFAGKPVPKHIVIPVRLVTKENVEQFKPVL